VAQGAGLQAHQGALALFLFFGAQQIGWALADILVV
jgi:hypothetical protein